MSNENGKISLTLTPDTSIATEIPVLKTLETKQETSFDFSAGAIDDSMLSVEEKEQVRQFASEIDIENVDQIVCYGEEAQSNISTFSTSILKKVKTYDLGEVGTSLKELTVAIDATMEPERHGIMGVFQKAKRGVNTVRANYAKAETNVDRIEKDLKKHKEILVADISMYQQLYDLNVEYYKQLTMYIIAGRMALADARSGKLQELKNKADSTEKQEDVQAYRDFEDLCYRFEKKLGDLETTRIISIQSAPQVRMLQNNDRELLDKLQSSISNTIPLWRNQLVLSLGIEHTKRALEAQTELTDKTNELLKQNSETLKMSTIETAKQSERPLVDVDTLKKCNKDLITSINEVVRIHEQGVQQRAKTQEELARIEEELKQSLYDAASRRK